MNEMVSCPICDGVKFNYSAVLWPELIADWELTQEEAQYINRQQGYCCKGCGNRHCVMDNIGYHATYCLDGARDN